MKKTFLTFTLAASVLALSACSDKTADDNEILATTKSGNITKEDLYEEMKDSVGIEAMQNLVLFKAIENEFKISDKDLKNAIAEQKKAFGDQFKTYLNEKGVTENFFNNQVKYRLLQEKLIESLKVTDEEINAEYEKLKKEIHARHILLEDEKTAEEIIEQLKAGEDFTKLAIENSIEPIAKQTFGDLGWFGPGKMVKPFEDAVFALPVGEISKPVKTSNGYHVIEVLETRDVEVKKTLEEMKPELENKVKEEQFNEKIGDLLKNAGIEFKAEEFKHIIDEYIK